MDDKNSLSTKSISAGNKIALLSIIVAVVGIIAGIVSSDIRNWALSALRSVPKPVVVGSRDYAEQYMIGEFIAQMLEENGVKVQRSFQMNGKDLRPAIEKGRIDVYMEYTGAAYNLAFGQYKRLDEVSSRNKAAVYDFVRKSYKKKGIYVSKPFNFENEWAILIRGKVADELKVETISDVVQHAESWTAAFVPDFIDDRVSGQKKFEDHYGLKFKRVIRLDITKVYLALNNHKVDIIVGNSTDGELVEFDMFQLKDDRNFFPPYQPIIVVREDTLKRVPKLKMIIEKLVKEIGVKQIRRMNLQVKNKLTNYPELIKGWIPAYGLSQ